MSNIPKPLVFFSLVLGFASAEAAAQQIRQPASMLPWQAPTWQPQPLKLVAPLAPAVPATRSNSDSPAWLLESTGPLAQQTESRDLPMVESEHYTNIGDLPASSVVKHRQAFPQKSAASPQSFNLFRSLGFPTTRPSSR